METNYDINRRLDRFPLYELKESSTQSRVVICPERGGIVISCQLHGQELLYLDRETFLNPEANIRGGIPILFPIAGQLREGQYEWNGVTYPMRNHGLARVLPWEVIGTENGDSASIQLALKSNEETLAIYPFEFELRFTYRLKNGVLSIAQEYSNHSHEAMPMVAGFHPYFNTHSKSLTYISDATRMLDYNDKLEKPFHGSLDLSHRVESVALMDIKESEISFPLHDEYKVRLTYSEEFQYIVLWSVESKPFVCVEPWTALNEALNDKAGLLMVPSGETINLELQLACEK